MNRHEAVIVLELMAIDIVGALNGLEESNPMLEVLKQQIEAIDLAQNALTG